MGVGVVGTQADGLAQFGDRCGVVARLQQDQTQVVVRGRIVGTQANRLTKLGRDIGITAMSLAIAPAAATLKNASAGDDFDPPKGAKYV